MLQHMNVAVNVAVKQFGFMGFENNTKNSFATKGNIDKNRVYNGIIGPSYNKYIQLHSNKHGALKHTR